MAEADGASIAVPNAELAAPGAMNPPPAPSLPAPGVDATNEAEDDDDDDLALKKSKLAVSSSPAPSERGGDDDGPGDFDCNICYDTAREPVVTMCGHLYCWPCLYR